MKKFLVCFFAVVVISIVFTLVTSADSLLMGDFNLDGFSDLVDTYILETYLSGNDPDTPLSETDFMTVADIYPDEIIDVRDAVRLTQYYYDYDALADINIAPKTDMSVSNTVYSSTNPNLIIKGRTQGNVLTFDFYIENHTDIRALLFKAKFASENFTVLEDSIENIGYNEERSEIVFCNTSLKKGMNSKLGSISFTIESYDASGVQSYFLPDFVQFSAIDGNFEEVAMACTKECNVFYYGYGDEIPSCTFHPGEAVVISSFVPQDKGIDFLYWRGRQPLDWNASNVYRPNDVVYPKNNLVLYADWSEGFTYEFNSENGHLDIRGVGMILSSSVPCEKTALKSVTVWPGVKSIPGMYFMNCTNLTNITISDTVEYIGEKTFDGTAYYNEISNWTDGVLYIGNHFIKADDSLAQCSVREGTITISNTAFYECRNLRSVYIPGSVKYIPSGAFLDCNKINNIVFGEGVEYIAENALSIIFSKNFSSVIIPKSLKKIEGNYFLKENLAEIGFKVPKIYIDSASPSIPGIYEENKFSAYISIFGDAEVVEYYSSGNCGKDASWTFDVYEGVLRISGSGKIEHDELWGKISDIIKYVDISGSFLEIGSKAFSNFISLERVYIYGAVKNIGERAFENCKSLIDISNSNFEHIGNYAFYDCRKLESFYLPQTIKTIGEGAFKNSNPKITGWWENIESIGKEAFFGCDGIEYVTLLNCLSIGEFAFSGSSLGSLRIGDKLINIADGAFSPCGGLKTIEVSENNPNYSSYENYLYNKDKTKLISVPGELHIDLIAESVTEISNYAFSEGGIQSIQLPDYAVLKSELVFKNVYFDCFVNPETIFISSKYAGKNMLEFFQKTLSFDIVLGDELYSGKCGDNLTWSLGIFDNGILFVEGTGDMYDYDFFEDRLPPWHRYRHGIDKVVVFDATRIGNMAFHNYTNIDSVNIGSFTINIGMDAFSLCLNLVGVDFYDLDNTSSIVEDYAFAECLKLKNFPFHAVKQIGASAFTGADFNNLNLYNGIEKIGSCAFSGNRNLKTVYIDENVKGLEECVLCGNEETLQYILLYRDSEAYEYFMQDEFYSSKVFCIEDAYGMCGENSSWKIDFENRQLLISGSGKMNDYDQKEGITPPWIPYAKFIDTIAIEEGISSIGYLDVYAESLFVPRSAECILGYQGYQIYLYRNSPIEKFISDKDDYQYSIRYLDGKCGKKLNWNYDYLSKTLYISGIGEMYDYDYEYLYENIVPWRWFDLSTVYVSEGVTSIGNGTWLGFGLNSYSDIERKIYIPKSVEKIGDGCFVYDINTYFYIHEGSYIDEYLRNDTHISKIRYLSVIGDQENVTVSGVEGVDFPEGTTIVVDPIKNEEGDFVIEGNGGKSCSYDITLTNNGDEIQPSDTIVVRIKVPKGFNGKKCKVYHKAEDGTLVDMEAVFENGYLVFTTNHFSVYVISDDSSFIVGDVNSDGEIDTKDAVLLAQYLAKWSVVIDEGAADCNADGAVDTKDAVLLAQYLAKWDVTLG